MSIAYLSHAACRHHEMGAGHPERPARLDAVDAALAALERPGSVARFEAPRADRAELARVHAPEYIEHLRTATPERGLVPIDPDTSLGPGTWEAALRAAGAVVRATDLLVRGEAARAFCAVRPPGHHAGRDHAAGFCFFNNVAVGAAHALEVHGLERVAIVDFDAHFGNGTVSIFAGEPRVLTCSIYQHPLYPWINPPSVPGHEINCPLPAGSGGDALRCAVTGSWLPALEDFRPQMLFISAGFDAAAGDPLADLDLRPADFGWVTGIVRAVANRHAGGRVVSTLEGGYDLAALGRCAGAHLAALMDGAADGEARVD